MRRLFSGLLGGALGSAVMAVFMGRMRKRLPPEDRYALPPRRIAMTLATKSGVGPPRRERDRRAVTLAAHYAYGTALGGVFSMVAPRSRSGAVLAGLPFGLAVWTGSYLGWLPAMGLHPPATQESAHRNALMVAAHFVWAGTIGAIVAALAEDRRP